MTDEASYEGWQELHGVAPSRVVRGWLSLVYLAGRPLARTGVHPDAVTAAALLVVVPVLVVPAWAAVLLVLLSSYLDGLDGCVAVLQGRPSAWGHLLDSTADRCSEALFVLAMVRADGDLGWGYGCLLAVVLLEYVRARAGAVLVITVAERPTRVIVTVLALAAGQGLLGLWALLGLTVVGLGQLAVAARRVT